MVEVDGEPVPKVIDFGIARATEQRAAGREAFTMAGQIIGTPEYMSPEQADLKGGDIDRGTDVFALGVVLYQLLVGVLPLDFGALQIKGVLEMLQAIRETSVSNPTMRTSEIVARLAVWAERDGCRAQRRA